MSETIKATNMTPEELEQWLDSLETKDTPPEYYFANPVPYAKVEPVPYEQRRHDFTFNEDGHIRSHHFAHPYKCAICKQITEEMNGKKESK